MKGKSELPADKPEDGGLYNHGTEQGDTELYEIEQRNKFIVGEEIEIMKPDGTNVMTEVKEIYDEDGNYQESAPHPKQKLYINTGRKLDKYDILRRKEK